MKKILGKILLALFVLVMLGYTAFTVYMVIGMQKPSAVEEMISVDSSEEMPLACAYAEITFEAVPSEYSKDGQVTQEFLEKLLTLAQNRVKLELLLKELELEAYSVEQVCGRMTAETYLSEENAVKLMVLDEDQYRAADLCNGVLVILKEADLSGLCSGMEIVEVGTE